MHVSALSMTGYQVLPVRTTDCSFRLPFDATRRDVLDPDVCAHVHGVRSNFPWSRRCVLPLTQCPVHVTHVALFMSCGSQVSHGIFAAVAPRPYAEAEEGDAHNASPSFRLNMRILCQGKPFVSTSKRSIFLSEGCKTWSRGGGRTTNIHRKSKPHSSLQALRQSGRFEDRGAR